MPRARIASSPAGAQRHDSTLDAQRRTSSPPHAAGACIRRPLPSKPLRRSCRIDTSPVFPLLDQWLLDCADSSPVLALLSTSQSVAVKWCSGHGTAHRHPRSSVHHHTACIRPTLGRYHCPSNKKFAQCSRTLFSPRCLRTGCLPTQIPMSRYQILRQEQASWLPLPLVWAI